MTSHGVAYPFGQLGGLLTMFQMVVGYLAVFAVAAIYYAWRDGTIAKERKRTTVNERVAYMLWVAANRS